MLLCFAATHISRLSLNINAYTYVHTFFIQCRRAGLPHCRRMSEAFMGSQDNVFVHVHGWVGRGYVSLSVQSRGSVGECTV